MPDLLERIKRRKVGQWTLAYLGAAWLALQLLDVVAEPWSLPSGFERAAQALLAVGLIGVVVLAWNHGERGRQRVGGLELAIVAGLTVLAGFLVRFALTSEGDIPTNVPVGAPPEGSVAVLPFRALSSGADDGYFADGLTEEIMNSLATLPDLLVTGRTSSFFFKDQDIPTPEIAARLGVAHVVVGSVRRSGEELRIAAQLVRARDGFQLWSQSYDRAMDDVFAIQQDIALNIAETLPIVLDDQKREQLINSGTRSIEAFIEFQRAYRVFDQAHLDLQTMMENLIPANELFEATLAVDPELGAAWFLHSDYFSHWLSIDAVLERDRDPASESEITAAYQTLMSDLERAVSATSAPEQRRIIDIEHRMFSDSWQGLGGIVETSAASRTCVTSNWFIGFAPLLPEPIAEFYSRAVLCDPLNYLNWLKFFASTHWTGDAEALRSEIARGIEVTGTRTTWTEWYRVQSHLLEGDFASARSVPTDFQGEGLVNVPYEVNILAAEGRAEEARALFSSLYDPTIHRLDTQLMMAAIVGDREEANRIASSIDGRPVSELALLMTTLFCACGEVFDLDATPEFKARVSESGLAWPPATLVSYPAKTW